MSITIFSFAGTNVFYDGEDIMSVRQGSLTSGALYYNDDSPNYTQIMALLNSNPIKFLKIENGEVIERTQAEKDIILQAEADAQAQAEEDALQRYDVSNLELLTALVKRINVRMPSNPITKQEIIDQIKADR